MRKSLFEETTFQACLKRIEQIKPDTSPQWGSMSASQMFAHCAEVQEVGNGTKKLEGTPLLVRLFKGTVKKMVYNDRPYKKNTPTHPQYKQIDQKDFKLEKERLLKALLYAYEHPGLKVNHPLFGINERQENGWAYFKHLDHHLTQFSV